MEETPHPNFAMKDNGTDSTSLEGSSPERSNFKTNKAKGNTSDEASDYFTEELATSNEDISKKVPPPPPVDFPSDDDSTSSQTDTSIDSKSRISSFTKESMVENTVRKRSTTQVAPVMVQETVMHSENSECVLAFLVMDIPLSILGDRVEKFNAVMNSLYKHCTAANLVNVLMVLM